MIFWDSSALVVLLVSEPESAGRLAQLQADPQLSAALSLEAAGVQKLAFACADQRLNIAAQTEGLECI